MRKGGETDRFKVSRKSEVEFIGCKQLQIPIETYPTGATVPDTL